MSSINRRSWEEFRASGLLWWVNRIIHTFGWAICLEVDEEDKVLGTYPAVVTFRGFTEEDEQEGFEAMKRLVRADEVSP
jgi:hypothetical protein